ncbi:hypothetical protein JCM11491_003644 [Sporobolomyces phaffii]
MSLEPLPPSLTSYNPTGNEKEAYNYLFKKADTESLGVLTGDLAVPFFSHSSLPPILLGEIWQISDPENNGFLTPERFGVACRLIGHAQEEKKTNGVPEVKQEWVSRSGPFPSFKGYPIPSHLTPSSSASAPTAAPSPPASLGNSQRAAPPAPASRLTAQTTGPDINQIKQDDKTKYARLFAGANGGSLTGLLEGEKARDIFIKSNLPYETLGQIWNLADTHARGSLDLPDFTIGMHLLQLVLNGQLSQEALPKVLDPKMYASAAGLNASGPATGVTPQSPLRQSSIPPPRNVASPPPQQPQFQSQAPSFAGGAPWKITPQEKQESDNWFGQLDTSNKGVLEGEQAVGFFGQSGLGVEDLAKIWDLSDITDSGNLNRDTFAVAMKLIREKVSNPGGFQLPDQLPIEYIPPSLRSDSSSSRSGPFSPPPHQQQMSQPQRDLVDLMGDDDTPSSPTPASPPPASSFAPLQPQLTGPIQRSLSPQATGSSFQGLQGTIFPQATGSRAGSGMISPQATGTPRGSGFQNDFDPSRSMSAAAAPAPVAQQPRAPAPASNFFDDNDLADTTSNLESLRSRSAQLEKEDDETSRSLKSSTQTREELEAEVEKVNAQISALQEKVSASRQQLETERTAVEDLKKREQDQKGVLSRAKTELISSESDLSGLKMEKSELEGEFLRDKEEVREVKKRLTMVEEEKRILRGEIEKLKKEGRREKGLGAIARKQLVSAESDRGKLEQDFETLKTAPIEHEVEAAAPVAPAATRQVDPAALSIALPRSTVTSPTASLRSNNPFDKLNLASAGLSPQPTGQSTTSNSNPNPFPFASASPTAASFPAPEDTPRDISSGSKPAEDKVPNVQDSVLPIASAAAGVLGAGALYALETAGSSVAHAFGVGSPTTEAEPKDKEVKQADEKEDGEVDPFGVPSQHAREETASTNAFNTPSTSTAGFGDDFGSTSFGDDFAQAPARADEDEDDTARGTLGDVDNDAGFDEAFEELKPAHQGSEEPSVTTGGPEVVEGKLGELNDKEGFDDAFQDFQPDTREEPSHTAAAEDEQVSGTLGEIDQGAGFDDAFDELEEHHKLDKGKGKEVVRDDASAVGGDEDVFAESTEDHKPSLEANKGEELFIEHANKAGDEDSSDDEEDGPEDLDRPSAFTRRSLDVAESPAGVPAPSTSTSTFDSPSQLAREGTSNSESGESYVHVSGSTAESSGILETEETPAIAPLPVPTPVAVPVPAPTQRRAAPPPPNRSAIVTPPLASASEKPKDVSFPVSDDFDDGFDGTRLRDAPAVSGEQTEPVDSPWPSAQVIAPTASHSEAAPEDDFESSFADMSVQPSAAAEQQREGEPKEAAGFDTFDDDFDFKPSFDADPVAAEGAPAAKENFDESAFAEFDDSFPATSSTPAAVPASAPEPAPTSAEAPTATQPTGSTRAPERGFSFDDSFGKFPFADTSSSSTSAPPALAPPVASPPPMARMPSIGQGDARDNDTPDVKEICGMGFPRAQAIEALAKYDHDVNRAINSLLG